MDGWSAPSDTGHVGQSLHNSRILATISGNVQAFATDSKHHLDYKPYLHTTRAVSEPHYLAPCMTLGSNDRQPLNNRLALHKARRSSQPTNKVLRERPYLQNEKYLEYRKRKRQDLGKDNKPIWPDHIEASFQNALVNIPPLGRKKRTQRGKLLGRNELIREWILHETGEDRDRKQISSHIQVLGNVFKDVPEWKMVTSRIGNEDDDSDHGTDYYYGSIKDKVDVLKELSKLGSSDYNDIDSMMSSTDTTATVKRMTFDMWVGMPDKGLKSLHNYTRISDQGRPAPTIELERYENWETLFPDLKALLGENQVDVVLLKSRFDLMSDYPPTTSKLVLDLDLDFRNFDGDHKSCSWMRYFTSVNHLYHNGTKIRRSEHKDCLAVEPGVVKPFFEAEWWATQFTQVTRKMKESEEAKDPDVIAHVEEYSRSLFRGLTIMQEIFVSPQHSECVPSQPHRRRVAVLLWVFAQTSKSNIGTTTWQHVTVQSHSLPQISYSMDDTCLPPLPMDSVVDDAFNVDRAGNSFSFDTTTPMSPIPYEPGAYHSGFTPYHAHQDPNAALDFGATGFTPRANSFAGTKPDPISLMMPLNTIPAFLPSQNIPDDKMPLFALPTQPSYETVSGPGPATYNVAEPLAPEYSLRRDSLAHFDMSTHDMLQAQLGDFTSPHSHQPHSNLPRDQTAHFHSSQPHDANQVLHNIDIDLNLEDHLTIPDADPDSQRSMIGHMDSLDLDEESLSQISQAMLTDNGPGTPTSTFDHAKLMLEHPAIFESPKLTRPPLLAHNSFAGVLPDHEDEPLHFDTPTRNEFARVISGQLDRDDGGNLFGNENVMNGFVMVETCGDELPIGRPRSQPVLGSNEDGGGYSKSDPVCLDTPA